MIFPFRRIMLSYNLCMLSRTAKAVVYKKIILCLFIHLVATSRILFILLLNILLWRADAEIKQSLVFKMICEVRFCLLSAKKWFEKNCVNFLGKGNICRFPLYDIWTTIVSLGHNVFWCLIKVRLGLLEVKRAPDG